MVVMGDGERRGGERGLGENVLCNDKTKVSTYYPSSHY